MKDEFSFIKFLKNRIGAHPRIEIGIGDDACAFSPFPGKWILLTTDAFREGIHFKRNWMSIRNIGEKSLLIALSDIAACGGVPVSALVNLSLPENFESLDYEDLYSGLIDIGNEYNCPIGGGDLNINENGKIEISVFIVGEVEPGYLTLRSGAKIEDEVFVTGNLGLSHLALALLEGKIKVPEKIKEISLSKFFKPVPRIKEVREILRYAKINSTIDISDGLSKDARHIAEESFVQIVLEEKEIPVHNALFQIKEINPFEFAIESGEEYEILFTLSEEQRKKIPENLMKQIPLKKIGYVKEGKGVFIKKMDGTLLELKGGYDHFQKL